MNVEEFKNKYPHLSHLEGEELWNAIEDAWLHEHKNDPEIIYKDWKGNEIQEGDEIVLIRTKIRHPKMGMFMPGTKETIWFDTPPTERIWEIVDSRKVYRRPEGDLCYDTEHGEYKFTMPLSMLNFTSSDCIVGIKGLSDEKK